MLTVEQALQAIQKQVEKERVYAEKHFTSNSYNDAILRGLYGIEKPKEGSDNA